MPCLFVMLPCSDMEQEKAVLIRQTYPKLKAYCRERYGVDFHVIDPKWGVRYRPRDDQATLDLCVKEIQRCQRTIGPDFVVSKAWLISNFYVYV